MKPTFSRLLSFVLSAALGLAVSFSSTPADVSNQLIPPVERACPESASNLRLDGVVISVPADGEFYVRKQRVTLAQISDALSWAPTSGPCGERVVYIKSAGVVKFETLALVITEVKRANIDRIEFILDKKKRGGYQR
ncbi:MAG TPA: biopolymer transporter ExbD [Pyrinomonadaceae bacterium]